MTIAEMRTLLGLGSEVSDAAVVDAYVVYLEGATPGEEPVTIEAARLQLGMTDDDTGQDGMIEGLIGAAREMVEGYTGLILAQRQIVRHGTSFDNLTIKAWPVQSIDAVTYIDAAGVEQVLASTGWTLTATARGARLRLASGAAWPIVRGGSAEAITVVATAGYAQADDVPRSLRQAMLILITALFDQLDGGSLEKAERAAKAIVQPFVRYI